MSALLPNQSRILAEICSNPAVIAEAQLNIPRATVEIFLENCTSFVQKNVGYLALNHYVLELSSGPSSGIPLNFSNVLQACTTEKPILVVNEDLLFQHSSAGGVRVTNACEETRSEPSIRVLVHGTYLYIVVAGQLVAESDAIGPAKNPPLGAIFDKPAIEIPAIIRDHFVALVRKERGFKYWHDPAKRLLVASPESTERLFQRSLFVWMDSHIVDKLRVYAEPRSMGQDATDVTVVTVAGEHIVEVKWLGKNVNNTEYKQDRIDQGLKQVGIYLDNDVRAIRGYVLLYDARPRDKHEKESSYDPAVQHERCECPIILFLESDTPSQAAKLKSSSANDQTQNRRKQAGVAKVARESAKRPAKKK
jgi:hypothetical protein